MASKHPRRSHMTSDLKFMAQITYGTMFVWTFLAYVWTNDGKIEERKKKDNSHLTVLDLLCFAAGKNNFHVFSF